MNRTTKRKRNINNSNIGKQKLEMNKRRKKKTPIVNLTEKCTICQYEVEDKSELLFLPCCHFYHPPCIIPWIKTNITCPECRIPIFIRSHEEMDVYNEFKEEQRVNPELIRDNVLINDNSLALMFIRDPELFSISQAPDSREDNSKILSIIKRPEISLSERYRDLIDEFSEEVSPSNSIIASDNESEDSAEARAVREALFMSAREYNRILNTQPSTSDVIARSEEMIDRAEDLLRDARETIRSHLQSDQDSSELSGYEYLPEARHIRSLSSESDISIQSSEGHFRADSSLIRRYTENNEPASNVTRPGTPLPTISRSQTASPNQATPPNQHTNVNNNVNSTITVVRVTNNNPRAVRNPRRFHRIYI